MHRQTCISLAEVQDIKGLKGIIGEVSSSIQLVMVQAGRSEIDPAAAVVVLFSEDSDATLSFLKSGRVPEATPILCLGTEKQLDALLESYRPERFVDFMSFPAQRKQLINKLHFLTRVHTLAVERQNSVATLNQYLEILYNRDGLTGLYTRRYLTDQLQNWMRTCLEDNSDLSLLILNIDYFNNVNKSLGLDFGDFLLNAMAARLTSTMPKNGSSYRFSGEDFVVLLPGTNVVEAARLAGDISKICSGTPFSNGEHSVSITVSIGIASLLDHRPNNHSEFLSMAESALFTAKTEGRNRSQVYTGPDVPRDFSTPHTIALLKENLGKIRERTRKSVINSLELLTSSIAEPGHLSHIRMVSEYLDLFADHLGLPERHIETFRNAVIIYSSFRCQLHKDIYSQPGKLSRDAKNTVQDLPFKLNELVDMFDYFSRERTVLLNHCERFDGTGYPLGLQQDEIPLSARIFHIIDALAAMKGERPYRQKLTATQIIDEFLGGAGRQFDPYLVDQIFQLMLNHQIIDIDPLVLRDKRQQLLDRFSDLKL
jgi:diguanylate cyclase (GGDEF)-like protein